MSIARRQNAEYSFFNEIDLIKKTEVLNFVHLTSLTTVESKEASKRCLRVGTKLQT